jgi:hypothetical protein
MEKFVFLKDTHIHQPQLTTTKTRTKEVGENKYKILVFYVILKL